MHLQIAVIMGCNPIYLIGCDHRYHLEDSKKKGELKRAGVTGAEVWAVDDAKGATHFTNKCTGGEKKIFVTPEPECMEKALGVARKWCEKLNIRIINATPDTGLKVFPLADYARLPEPRPKTHCVIILTEVVPESEVRTKCRGRNGSGEGLFRASMRGPTLTRKSRSAYTRQRLAPVDS